VSSALDALLHSATVWRGGELSVAPATGIASGFAAIDEKLGGWPSDSLVELIPQREGVGELSLFLPALARLSRKQRWIVFVDAPYVPYAPALAAAGIDLAKLMVVRARSSADALWAMEQALRSGACSAVLGWPGFFTEQAIRRLQLAAQSGPALGICFTACGAVPRASPVPYRLRVDAQARGVRVEILKRRGGGPIAPLFLENVVSASRYVAVPGFSPPAPGSVPAGARAA
jgi:protein ImuA